MLKDQTILITGGAGSLGQALVRHLLDHCSPAKLIIYSRDDGKHYAMQQAFGQTGYPAGDILRFFLGDVRDLERLKLAFSGVDVVIHAAALKQIPLLEYNPIEAIRTNVEGSQNVVLAAVQNKVKRVIGISSDKATAAVNLYGSTKHCMEKLFSASNVYGDTIFGCVRYGNVAGSRGSVVPVFRSQLETGSRDTVLITDMEMTRFWYTLDEAVAFVLNCLEWMEGGELFIPKLPSFRIPDLAKAMGAREFTVIGIRDGEKLHESMISPDESPWTWDLGGLYSITSKPTIGTKVERGFSYSSGDNPKWLDMATLHRLCLERDWLPGSITI